MCTVPALTAGVVSTVITALLVAGISVAIHIAVYQCLYKPRLRSEVQNVSGYKGGRNTGIKDGSCCKGSQENSCKSDEDNSGHDYAVIYEVVGAKAKGSSDNNIMTMTSNQVYGLTDSIVQ